MHRDPDAPPLPLELFLLIVDFVGEDYDEITPVVYRTLRACALTCHAWLARARMHLYAYVFLERRVEYLRFARTIHESPELADLVQEMRCDLYGQTNHERGWAWDYPLMNAGSMETPIPLHVVARLTNLKKLSFEADPRTPIPVALSSFVRSFGVLKNLETLILYSCLFFSFDHLAGTIWSFPYLKKIRISQTTWYDTQLPPTDGAMFPGKGDNLAKYQLFLPMAVDPLLALLGPNVLHLSLWSTTYDSDVGFQDSYQAVSWYTALESLSLTFERRETDWLLQVLGNVQAQKLEAVRIDYISRDELKDDVVTLLHDIRLDDVLSTPPFRHLTEVTINVQSTVEDEDGAWIKSVEAEFPQCVERGILRAAIEPWVEEYWLEWLMYD